MIRPPSDEDIQDLLDNRLDADRLREVDAFLAAHPERAEEVRALRQQDEALRQLSREMLVEPIPARLRAAVAVARQDAAGAERSAAERKARSRRWPVLAAAAALAFFIGTATGWLGKGVLVAPPDRTIDVLVEDFYAAYAYATSASGFAWDFRADEADGFADWSSQSFGTSLTPIDLSDAGYEFIGVRVLPGPSRLAGLLQYRAEENRYVAIYFWKGDAPPDRLSAPIDHRGMNILMRSGDHVGVAVASQSPQDQLEKIAEVVFKFYSTIL
jgi:anti-sigma factor RsiW